MSPEQEFDSGERAEKARRILQDIMDLMEADAEVASTLEDEQVMLTVTSREKSTMPQGKKGQFLDALQFIVARILARTHPGPEHIVVDADGYRERRADQLRAMAHQVAQRVREERVPYAFDPSLTNAERRIVHMELKDEPDLSTQSEGEGEKRRLVVYPRSQG